MTSYLAHSEARSDIRTSETSSEIVLSPTAAIAPSPAAVGPLAVLISPSGHHTAEAGETFEISLTIYNQGPKGAIVDAYLESSSLTSSPENSQRFNHWCANPYERLALETGHSGEVRFQLTLPTQTLPGSYDYIVVIDAPEHYPEDTPLRYPATLRVLPPIKSAINLSDATFAIEPSSDFDRPIKLSPETPTELQIVVHNRSSRVDQFRLEVSDLPPDWYDISYPKNMDELGLSMVTDHLPLNPGIKGTIQLSLHLPPDTLAGRYLSTLRLRSLNNASLALMDLAYFEVPARYSLTVKPQAIVRNVRQQAAIFQLQVTNAGNTARDIVITPQEDREAPLFDYELEPPELHIPAMSTTEATLRAVPKGFRRRPWIGKGKAVSFRLETADLHQLPLPETTAADLLWESRPWWHLALVSLLAAGIASTALGLIWWRFLRPPAPPKITSFGSTAPAYYQQRDDFIKLSWRMDGAEQIQSIELKSLKVQSQSETDGLPIAPVVYDLSKGLPPELENYCVLARTLSCQNIHTGARQPGSYTFALSVVSKRDRARPITAETDAIAILPTPPPEIVSFTTTQPRYWESGQATRSQNRSQANHSQVNRSQAQSTESPSGAIALNWQINFFEPLSHLTIAARLGDGAPLEEPKRYDLSSGLPTDLEDYCTLTETNTGNKLSCQALPTNASTIGSYVFELKLFSQDKTRGKAGSKTEPIASAETEVASILALPVRIENFKINGQDAPAKYSVTLPTDTGNTSTSVKLSWQVTGGPYTKVEVLPSPGSVSTVGNLDYPITANTQEIITLKVTSVSGQTTTRSVAIEVERPIPTPPPINSSSTTSPPMPMVEPIPRHSASHDSTQTAEPPPASAEETSTETSTPENTLEDTSTTENPTTRRPTLADLQSTILERTEKPNSADENADK